jgi:hypothetical protein
VSQKLIAAATLLRAIEQAAVQQAESSASRIRQQGSARDDGGAQVPEPSVHAGGAAERPANPGRTPAKERLLDTRGQSRDGDARNVINVRRTSKAEARAAAGYHPRRGGRYDSDEDRSPTPKPPGTRVFSREIRMATFPQRFRQPTTIVKYNGETDPRVWLNDYRLACELGGATSDEAIIRNLPLHLTDSARTWLEHLPASQIHNCDLVRTFVGNFQGTYVRPGNSWDLRSCTQKPGESLRDFIRRFSKRCTEIPSVAQSEIVHAFLEGTTCRDLVRELGRNPPVDLNELFDIATSFASGEEAVGAIFDGKKGKRADDTPAEGSKSKELRQKNKRGKKGKKLHREAREQGRDDDDGGKALAVDPARRGPRAAPRGPEVFDYMLKKPCPYPKMPVNHTLEQSDMLKRFYGRAAAKDDEAKKDGGDGDAGGFPAVENIFLIFGGLTIDMSSRQRKRERHEVLAAEKAPPSFLD